MYSSQNQSKAWRFFEKQNNGQTVTCKLCGRSIKFHSSTTTMHQHLNSHHEKEVVKMERSTTTEEYEYDDENDDSEGVEYFESREHNDDTFGNDLAQIMKH
ncbi:Protein CBG21196 [Caenorhabditis briggsae]|uniref:Protein CBG21196 n=1 Tax=Caenorhabditis briggsae TaxID=6238 RepID=A8XZM6_CAEBR|nr:Protein CBG21196 [Caenorhabditis briggsae]CAP38025.1 Protein CBG21196 [Caenorhabditis briggsae]